MYCEHVPIEFENDRHYLYDTSDVDIEPVGQLNPGAFEWAGVFAVSGASHTLACQLAQLVEGPGWSVQP